MRLLVEILVAAAVIALGWEESFHQRVGELPVVGSYLGSEKVEGKARTLRALPASTTTQSTAPARADSILDPTHRTILDKPIDPPNKTFTGHITYKDEAGKTYWLDAQGRRHYQP